MWTAIFLFIIVCAGIYEYLRRTFYSDKYNGEIPCWKPQFFVGNLKQMGVLDGGTVGGGLQKMKAELGDVFQVFLGWKHSIAFNRPEYLEQIYSDKKRFQMAPSTSEQLTMLFPYGLITIPDGKMHQRHSRIMIHGLKVQNFHDSIPEILEEVDTLINYWERKQGKVNTETVMQLQNLLIDIIGKLFFNERFNCLMDLDNLKVPSTSTRPEDLINIGEAIKYMLFTVNRILLSIPPNFVWRFYLKYINKTFIGCEKIFEKYINGMIFREMTVPSEKKTILNMLVSSMKEENPAHQLSREEIIGEIKMAIFAGFETSSTTLTWCIYHLATRLDVQHKIKAELKEHGLPIDPQLWTVELLSKMEWLQCVIQETLRIAPIVPANLRYVATDDVTIGGYKIKKTHNVQIGIGCINSDPRFWSMDPSKFLPERFYTDGGRLQPEDKQKSAVMLDNAFGGGIRMCVGKGLAKFEQLCAVARMMQRLTFYLTDEQLNRPLELIQYLTTLPKKLDIITKFDNVDE